jgi:phosphoribosylaminoimidazolecarboxamide formyltransferase/IMP cyclohydrolase
MHRPLKIKRALISVSDKSNLESVAKALIEKNVEIISSGGTGRYLSTFNIPWTPVESITGNPEAFGGRMKTLSFQVSSSLLFRREHEEDIQQAKELNIEPIDMVICNLYPFVETAKQTNQLEALIENIDIGGPTMVRAAAKNYRDVTICVDSCDYDEIIEQLQTTDGNIDFRTREKLALKAFKHTASYDCAISETLSKNFEEEESERTINIHTNEGEALRYGENPHQWAKVVKNPLVEQGLAAVVPLQGKKLSYNNYLDADAAFRCTSDLNNAFSEKSIVTIIKHANPCGVAVSSNICDALERAWAGDPVSSFGSIICFNREVDLSCANFLESKFVEVIIAPSFANEALTKFGKKKNLRLIQLNMAHTLKEEPMVRSIYGGWVVQEEDTRVDLEFNQVTKNLSISEDVELLTFGSVVTKHLKSNAISLVRRTDNVMSLAGAGMGNPNRLVSTEQAISKALENGIELSECTLVSDAFFPFRDNVDLAAKSGIQRIVQPGGSIRDEEVITACDENNISMCFTGKRHFRH